MSVLSYKMVGMTSGKRKHTETGPDRLNNDKIACPVVFLI